MKLDQLRTFCALVEGGNLDEAARRIHRTQPAVSQHIKALESEFKHTLFERRAGRPTPAGRRLYQQATALLAAADALQRDMRAFNGGVQELIIGASDTNALYFLPRIVRRFRKTHPAVRLSIVCKPSSDVVTAVDNRELDLGIVTMPIDAGPLALHQLDTQPLVLITPRTDSLAVQTSTSPSRLAGKRFILLDAATRTGSAIERFLFNHGVQPIVAMRSGSFEVIKQYVAQGVGVAFVPARALSPADRRNLGVLRVPGLPKLAIGAIWRKSGAQPVAVAWFLNALEIPEPAPS